MIYSYYQSIFEVSGQCHLPVTVSLDRAAERVEHYAASNHMHHCKYSSQDMKLIGCLVIVMLSQHTQHMHSEDDGHTVA